MWSVTGNAENGGQGTFTWWMNSTPHRNNLLGLNQTQFGVGDMQGANSVYAGCFVAVSAQYALGC